MKKAEGLSIQLIMIAAIGIVVVLVSIFIFNKGVGDLIPEFGAQTQCESRQGNCKPQDVCVDEGGTTLAGLGCPVDEYCCFVD